VLPPTSFRKLATIWGTRGLERRPSILHSESTLDEPSTITSKIAVSNVCSLVRECDDFGDRRMGVAEFAR
jgi:hypothetical protein